MKPWLVLVVLLGVQWSGYAAECSIVFQDGLSTHGGAGVSFGGNARLINSPDNQINTNAIAKDNDSIVPTCNTADCSISQDGFIPDTSPGSFRASNGSQDVFVSFRQSVTFGQLGVNNYDFVQTSSEVTLNFGNVFTEYFYNNLQIGSRSVVNLRGGYTYWVGNLSLGENVTFNVLGEGTAIVYVNNSTLQISQSTLFNSPSSNAAGDASKLALYAYGNINMSTDSTVTGAVYAGGGLSLGPGSHIYGSSAAQTTLLDDNSTITFEPSNIALAELGDICEVGGDGGDGLPLAQCNAVFPDGISSHGGTGINFGFNSQVFGSPDGQLAANAISQNNGSTLGTCDSVDCSVDPNGLSETLSPGDFQFSSGTQDVSIGFRNSVTFGTFGVNNYDFVQSSSRATLNFGTVFNEYFFNTLNIGFANTVNLRGGSTYWIDELIIGSSVTFNVVGTGTATLYVNNSLLQILSSTLVNSPANNSSGDASKLVLYAYGSVSLNNLATVTGAVYAQSELTLGSASHIFGAVAAQDITLGSRSTVTYLPAQLESADLGELCGNSTLDHIEISHDGNGLTCEAEAVTFRACADAACNTPYDQDLQITLSPTAGWADSDGTDVTSATIVANSSLSLSFARADPQDVSLGVSGLPFECTGNPGNSCILSFADTGFQFIGASVGDTIPMQIAEQAFSSAQLRAVKTDDTSGSNQCVALLTGDQTVNFGLNCTSPSSCVKSLDANGTAVSEIGSSEVTLNFDADGFADLSVLTYPDAGEITLSAEAEIEGASIISASTEVDVRPVSLKIETTSSTSNQRAGLPFETTIAAYGAIGDEPLPNYRMGDIQFSLQRTAPTSANTVDGILTGPGGLSINSAVTSSFSTTGLSDSDPEVSLLNGINTFDMQYSEVATLSLSVRDANYLEYTGGISGKAPLPLGEFIPAYFDVEHVENKPAAFCQTPTASFSYLGQPLNFEDDWVFTISALNADGAVTQNYQGNKWDWLFNSGTGEVESAIQGTLTETEYSHNPQPGETLTMTNTAGGEASREEVTSGGVVEYGKQRVAISGMQFSYDKPDELIAEVDVDFNLSLSSALFTDETHLDDMGQPNTDNYICYFETYDKDALANCDADSDNNKKIISNLIPDEAGDPLSASTVRWGRIVLENVFGPENENLLMQVKTEYVVDTDPTARERLGFAPNRDDQCTNFVWSDGNFSKTDKSDENGYSDITGVVSISADFTVLDGITQGLEGISITAPSNGERGELEIRLVLDGDWDRYLQFDWDGDPLNGIQPPFATATFGQFRGNDRIIHWREIY